VTGKERPPGGNSWGPDDTRLSGGESFAMVTDGTVTTPAPFGRPSTYGLSPLELVGHIRELRRAGWQGWEIRARFTFGTYRDAA
jgi:hypothetical protein